MAAVRELQQEEPFSDVSEVINYLNTHNPARAKFRHRLEKVSGSTDRESGALWALVCSRTFRTLRQYTPERRLAFELYAINAERASLKSVDEISEILGRSRRTIYNWINQIRDDLDSAYVRAGLIPRDEYND